MDLSNLIKEKVETLCTDGTVDKLVMEAAVKLLKSSIDDVLCPYGDLAKDIKKELKERLRINFEEIPIDTYNHNMMLVVKKAVSGYFKKEVAEKLNERVTKIFSSDIPKEITISDLMEKFKEEILQYQEDLEGEIFFDYSDYFDSEYGLFYIYFDEECDKRKCSCNYSLMISRETGEIRNVKIGKSDKGRELNLGGLYGFDEVLCQMYAAGTKVICNEEEFNKVETTFGPEY